MVCSADLQVLRAVGTSLSVRVKIALSNPAEGWDVPMAAQAWRVDRERCSGGARSRSITAFLMPGVAVERVNAFIHWMRVGDHEWIDGPALVSWKYEGEEPARFGSGKRSLPSACASARSTTSATVSTLATRNSTQADAGVRGPRPAEGRRTSAEAAQTSGSALQFACKPPSGRCRLDHTDASHRRTMRTGRRPAEPSSSANSCSERCRPPVHTSMLRSLVVGPHRREVQG